MKYENPIMNISMFKAEQIKAGEQGGIDTGTGGDPLYSSNINAAITYANNTTLASVGANANKALVIIQFNN